MLVWQWWCLRILQQVSMVSLDLQRRAVFMACHSTRYELLRRWQNAVHFVLLRTRCLPFFLSCGDIKPMKQRHRFVT